MIRGGRVTLPVADVARSVRFYIETLGMKLAEEAPGSAVIDAGEGFLLELSEHTGKTKGSAQVTLFSKVPIAEAIAIYENRGVAFTVESHDGKTIARFHDLDANDLCIVAHA